MNTSGSGITFLGRNIPRTVIITIIVFVVTLIISSLIAGAVLYFQNPPTTNNCSQDDKNAIGSLLFYEAIGILILLIIIGIIIWLYRHPPGFPRVGLTMEFLFGMTIDYDYYVNISLFTISLILLIIGIILITTSQCSLSTQQQDCLCFNNGCNIAQFTTGLVFVTLSTFWFLYRLIYAIRGKVTRKRRPQTLTLRTGVGV